MYEVREIGAERHYPCDPCSLLCSDTLGNVGMYVGQYKRLKDRVGKITGLAPAMQLNSDVEIIDSGHTDWVTMVHYCEKSEVRACVTSLLPNERHTELRAHLCSTDALHSSTPR